MRYLSQQNLAALLLDLKRDYEVFVPVRRGHQRLYEPFEGWHEAVALGEPRPFEPLKAFIFRGRERVAEDFKDELPEPGRRPACVVGVKACDLKGFKIEDHVFLGEDADPFYQRAREQTLLIATDCTGCLETCFCTAMDVTPHATEGFDLNLSPVEGGYLVEPGSSKGEALLAEHDALLADAADEHLRQRQEHRDRVRAEVEANIEREATPTQDRLEGVVARGFDADIWREESETCVECGACNTICPTCHCFYLYDQADAAGVNVRHRCWDACLLKGFAREAGGGNPRPRLWMRLRNRFEKKFDFFPKVAGLYACTGCGRCILCCPAKIDIRQVLRRLVEHAGQ